MIVCLFGEDIKDKSTSLKKDQAFSKNKRTENEKKQKANRKEGNKQTKKKTTKTTKTKKKGGVKVINKNKTL